MESLTHIELGLGRIHIRIIVGVITRTEDIRIFSSALDQH